MECFNGVDGVIAFLTLATILALVVVEITLMLTNPLAALIVGILLDQAISALVDVSGNCQ